MLVSQLSKRHYVHSGSQGLLGFGCTHFQPTVELVCLTDCVLPFPAGTDLSLSNEYGNTPLHLAQSRLRILQEGSLTGRTPDAVKAEVSEVRSTLAAVLYHHCGVWHHLPMGDRSITGWPGCITGSSSKELTTRTLTSPNVDS